MKRANRLVSRCWMLLLVVAVVCFSADQGFPQNKAQDTNKLITQAAQAQPAATVYDAVLAGKACKDDEATQSLTCEYKAGTGLHFLIEGLGQPDTGITFFKSSADEDFFASFAILHGCVIVSRGEKGGTPVDAPDFAFISPKNGKVYKSWEECKEGW